MRQKPNVPHLRLLTEYYSQFLKSNMNIVDLCASWDSHFPEKLQFTSTIGVGIVEEELVANKRLRWFSVGICKYKPGYNFECSHWWKIYFF